MSLTKQLNWRYAAKHMNGTKVPQEKIEKIFEAIRLTPTAFGMQAFKILIVESQELKEKIFESACQQPQIIECSHLLIFAAIRKITNEHVNEYIDLYASTRELSVDSMSQFKGMLNSVVNHTEETNFNWTSRQTYIALGFAMVAAAEQEVDSTPIEGFKPKALDELLQLNEQNLGSVLLLPLGYRDEANDKNATAKKVRKKTEDIFIYL